MENSNLPQVVIDRWNEAVESNSVPAWRSLASMSALQAEMIARDDSDNIIAFALFGISVAAFDKYIKLQKVNEHANIA